MILMQVIYDKRLTGSTSPENTPERRNTMTVFVCTKPLNYLFLPILPDLLEKRPENHPETTSAVPCVRVSGCGDRRDGVYMRVSAGMLAWFRAKVSAAIDGFDFKIATDAAWAKLNEAVEFWYSLRAACGMVGVVVSENADKDEKIQQPAGLDVWEWGGSRGVWKLWEWGGPGGGRGGQISRTFSASGEGAGEGGVGKGGDERATRIDFWR